ncbi:EEPD1-like protein [Mya arenaria]|uniref:Endonuclease/exonuclease/phosphatase family domain-containing protein 1 n=1 Tax=Mya arenaria TaxID=6604 RepID=A0ABY7ETT6_MYAAR|nr:EEPD1-like protein [Mya arenaria]
MGAVNSCCIPRKSGIEEEKVAKNGFRKHKRQLSAAFNMTLLDEENKALVKNQLDINTATEEELMTLPGINRVTAKQIVDYRRQIRGFKLVEDLALVSGVGAVRLEAIRHEIIVNKKVNGNGSPENGRMSNKRESSGPRVVNLNTANVFQLMKVKGIGQTLAENIVTYRDKKGHFTNIDDLIKVKGIGHHVLSAIKPQLTLDENVTSDSVSYSSSKKSSNLNNSAIPSRTSDISLNSENNSINPPNECSKGSLENLLETLGPFSEKAERPAVDFPTFKCNNRGAVRVASWNLQCFSSDKALNPGVKDVICDELNAPTLPNVTRWAGQRGKWKCIVSESTGRMYMSNEYNGFLYDESQGISLISSCLLAKDRKQKPFTRRPFIATFKIKRFDCAMVSVHLKATGLDNEDLGRLQEEIDKMPNLVAAIQAELPGERDIILLGDFNLSPDAQEGVFTNISEANKKGSKTYDNIWLAKQTKQVFTAGWKWGGVVSDHCPIWAQLYTGKDLDTGDIKIGTEAIRFALGND